MRNAAQRKLSGSKNIAAPALVDTLRRGRLSQQLGALSMLISWQAPVAGIDPWQPETINAASVQPLIECLQKMPASESDTPKAEIEELPIDEQVRPKP